MKAERKRMLMHMRRCLKQRYGSVQMVFYFKKRSSEYSLTVAMMRCLVILNNLEGPPNDGVL